MTRFCIKDNTNRTKMAKKQFKVIPKCCIVHPYCARFSASLAHTNERVHENNERNFPQAELNSEINACFLLNGHGNLSFLLHNNVVHIILLN